MDGRYGLYRQNSGLWRSLRDGDFEEDDVWDVLKERTSVSSLKICASMEPPSPSSSSSSSSCSSSSGSMPLLSAAKMIPRPSSNGRNNKGQNLQKSAPVTIPRWPETYPKKSNKTPRDDDDGDGDGDGDSEEEEEEEDDDDKLPPHEYVARRLARSHISSFSVLEGIGRTLKGRDLSKVRNAILTKTGFLE